MSMMLEEMCRPARNPRCSFLQNLLANGVRMRLRSAAMMRLSVFTTEMGRRLAGVYAGPKCCEMLDGFLGSRGSVTWLKSVGGVGGLHPV